LDLNLLEMSGIEVVGLVLGAFPLAISALEHARESFKVLHLLANFEDEWRKTLNDIKDEYLIYTLNLKLLFLPLVDVDQLDEQDVEDVLADPGSASWKAGDEALRERLGSAFSRFLENAQELQQLLKELLTVIGIDNARLQTKMKAAQVSDVNTIVPCRPADSTSERPYVVCKVASHRAERSPANESSVPQRTVQVWVWQAQSRRAA
jgi:hypothetical protein